MLLFPSFWEKGLEADTFCFPDVVCSSKQQKPEPFWFRYSGWTLNAQNNIYIMTAMLLNKKKKEKNI